MSKFAQESHAIKNPLKQKVESLEIVVSDPGLVELNNKLSAAVKAGLGEAVHHAWFKNVYITQINPHPTLDAERNLMLTVPNEKIKYTIFLHYQNRFEKILKKVFFADRGLKVKHFDLQTPNDGECNNLTLRLAQAVQEPLEENKVMALGLFAYRAPTQECTLAH